MISVARGHVSRRHAADGVGPINRPGLHHLVCADRLRAMVGLSHPENNTIFTVC